MGSVSDQESALGQCGRAALLRRRVADQQVSPTSLVIRTSNGEIRWMDVSA